MIEQFIDIYILYRSVMKFRIFKYVEFSPWSLEGKYAASLKTLDLHTTSQCIRQIPSNSFSHRNSEKDLVLVSHF